MSEHRWIVEMVLPEGTFESRAIVTERSPEELERAVRDSVTELLAWKHQEPPTTRDATRNYYETHSHLQSRRRLLMAHCADSASAEKIAADLSTRFPTPVLPWTEPMRIDFLEFMQGVLHRLS